MIGKTDAILPSALSRQQLIDDVYKAGENLESARLYGQLKPGRAEQETLKSDAANKQASPILVTRNSIVSMEYAFGRLTIQTEGRAMSQGRAGELVRIMNLNSKSVVAATVVGPSKVVVR